MSWVIIKIQIWSKQFLKRKIIYFQKNSTRRRHLSPRSLTAWLIATIRDSTSVSLRRLFKVCWIISRVRRLQKMHIMAKINQKKCWINTTFYIRINWCLSGSHPSMMQLLSTKTNRAMNISLRSNLTVLGQRISVERIKVSITLFVYFNFYFLFTEGA